MKKMTKRIMALMLSLVMILGCIPSFINEVSAAGDNYIISIDNAVIGGPVSGLSVNLDGTKINEIQVFKQDGTTQVAGTDPFEEGKYIIEFEATKDAYKPLTITQGTNSSITFDSNFNGEQDGASYGHHDYTYHVDTTCFYTGRITINIVKYNPVREVVAKFDTEYDYNGYDVYAVLKDEDDPDNESKDTIIHTIYEDYGYITLVTIGNEERGFGSHAGPSVYAYKPECLDITSTKLTYDEPGWGKIVVELSQTEDLQQAIASYKITSYQEGTKTIKVSGSSDVQVAGNDFAATFKDDKHFIITNDMSFEEFGDAGTLLAELQSIVALSNKPNLTTFKTNYPNAYVLFNGGMLMPPELFDIAYNEEPFYEIQYMAYDAVEMINIAVTQYGSQMMITFDPNPSTTWIGDYQGYNPDLNEIDFIQELNETDRNNDLKHGDVFILHRYKTSERTTFTADDSVDTALAFSWTDTISKNEEKTFKAKFGVAFAEPKTIKFYRKLKDGENAATLDTNSDGYVDDPISSQTILRGQAFNVPAVSSELQTQDKMVKWSSMINYEDPDATFLYPSSTAMDFSDIENYYEVVIDSSNTHLVNILADSELSFTVPKYEYRVGEKVTVKINGYEYDPVTEEDLIYTLDAFTGTENIDYVVDELNGTFTFTMPDHDVNISGTKKLLSPVSLHITIEEPSYGSWVKPVNLGVYDEAYATGEDNGWYIISDDGSDEEYEESTYDAGKYSWYGEIDGDFSNLEKVYVNGKELEQVGDVGELEDYTKEGFYNGGDYIEVYTLYNVSAPSSGSSKKYKATDNKDTTEKITGTGKKGSTRNIIPEEGKKVTDVIVKDKDGNRVEVTKNEDGTYSFTQPASNVTVEVLYETLTPEEEMQAKLMQDDVKKANSNEGNKINPNAKFVKGYEDGTFKPNKEVSNLELMCMVTQLFEDTASLNAKEEIDLNQGDNEWAGNVAALANGLGLIPGNKNDKNYDLNSNVTRGDLAVVIYNLIKDYTPCDKLVDSDNCKDAIGKDYEEAVAKLVSLGILKGYDDGLFHGDNTLTRAEAVVVINRALISLGFEIKIDSLKVSFPDLSQSHWAYDEIMFAANK